MVRIDSPDVQEFEKAHLSTLRSLAPECMVLLKKNGDFPLPSPCEIALYGAGARETIKGGTGSGDVNVRHSVTVEEGLENAGFTVTTKAWMDGYKAIRDSSIKGFYEGIAREAKELGKSVFLVGMGRTPPEPRYELPLDGKGEVCVYVLSRNSGEGADRPGGEGDYLLTGDEVRDILACAEKYTKFMLVLNVGGPVDITPVLDKVESVLLLSQLGSVTGDAFADVLLGKANPSGKLTTTWAKAGDIMTIGDFAERDDTRYKEGIFAGYRYYDAAGVKPLFPFGYGLSFTEFETDCTGFSVENGIVTVEATIRNTGRFPGKETAQLYYSAPNGKLIKPLRELGAYRKTRELLPGESETLVLDLPMENMASWDTENDCWLLEQGKYLFSLGSMPVGTVFLDGNATSDPLSHSGGEANFEDWQPQIKCEIPEGLPCIRVSAAALGRIGHYDREKALKEHIGLEDLSEFSIKELATICAGKHSDAEGMAAIIGNSASRLAGGAGETATILKINTDLSNVWFGVTITRKSELWRLQALKENVRAKHYHVTFEPLFDDPGEVDLTGIDWIVVGTMTGAMKKKVHTEPAWAYSLTKQAHALKIPVFMKEDLVSILGEENMIQELPAAFNKVMEEQKKWNSRSR